MQYCYRCSFFFYLLLLAFLIIVFANVQIAFYNYFCLDFWNPGEFLCNLKVHLSFKPIFEKVGYVSVNSS